jgi:creatinine amidohydrolase/Fe(II)-dependent formamide hydrolase-like protein
MSVSGVRGDATKATLAKGEQFLAAAVEGLVELVREFKTMTLPPRQNHH